MRNTCWFHERAPSKGTLRALLTVLLGLERQCPDPTQVVHAACAAAGAGNWRQTPSAGNAKAT